MSPFFRAFLQRIEASWSLDHPGQQSGLEEVQILWLFAEVVSAGSVQANDFASAELDLVEVGGEQFLFADRAIECPGMPNLGPFALQFAEHVSPLQIVEDQVLEELHRDRAATPAQATAKHRAKSDKVNAAVVHQPLVLDRNDRLLHRFRDLVRLQHNGTATVRIQA